MNIDLNELERTAKAATPGPWHQSAYGTVFAGDNPMDGSAVITDLNFRSRNDMRFIADANPATVLALIARIRELEAIEQLWHSGVRNAP